MKKYIICIVMLWRVSAVAQENRINVGWFDGIVMAGYVNNGGFLNFAGPNLSYTNRNSKIMVGMLPSLRFKEDHADVKNAWITPNLGLGVTYSYKKIAFQIPFYYNSKTAITNGKWVGGIGIGVKLK